MGGKKLKTHSLVKKLDFMGMKMTMFVDGSSVPGSQAQNVCARTAEETTCRRQRASFPSSLFCRVLWGIDASPCAISMSGSNKSEVKPQQSGPGTSRTNRILV